MDAKEFLNRSICHTTGVKETKGDKFGLELELEGRNVALQDVAVKGWNRHVDPSLRGEAIEYATAGSKSLDDSRKAVTDLFKKFKENGVKFNDSIRTSTHVHLNFSDKLVKQAINFFTLFTLLEEVLQYYSGEDRKGNLFCITTREAEGIVGILAGCVAKGDLQNFAGDRYKYAACNLSTLYKFGTIEVRTMRGATSADQVNNWLNILNDMYKYACDVMKSPAELVTDLSHQGAMGLMRKIFSPKSLDELLQGFPAVTLYYSLMEGARLLQVFAYGFEEAYNAKVEPSEKGAEEGELLPKNVPAGPFRGQHFQIYKPDGQLWNCATREGGLFWRDGQKLSDDKRIQWSAAMQRFVFVYPDGERVPCNWRNHHILGNEGPPLPRRALEGRRHAAFEEEFEEEAEHFEDEFEEIEFDDGDDF
jgi:hypothetical protein